MINNPTTSTNHYLQSDAWALSRSKSPWKILDLQIDSETVRVYLRRTPLGLVVHILGYYPDQDHILLLTEALQRRFPRAITCKLETCAPYDKSLERVLIAHGWMPARTTQYTHTIQLDLTKSEAILRSELKKRARNEINRAINNQVKVIEKSPSDVQLEVMYKMLNNTATRKSFNVHDRSFIFTFWRSMREKGKLRLFFAEQHDVTLAGAMIAVSQDGKKAWYKEGASTTSQPGLNAPRYLLWKVALMLKASGIEVFDLGGIPDPATYGHSAMKGVFIFKTAYSPEITRMMPAYELPLNAKYKLWPKLELALRKYAQSRHTNWF